MAWIDGHHARVATVGLDGEVMTCEVSRGWLSEPTYLRQVVRVIGDRERVVILGPSSIRSELEQSYVAMFQPDDRLVDVEPPGAVEMPELVERLHTLSA